MDRRTFLGRTAAGMAGMAIGGVAMSGAGGRRGLPLGVQLYTVRDRMADDLPGTLRAVAGFGYREVEFAGLFGHDPAEVRAILDGEGLTAPSAHVGLDDLRGDGLDRTLETAETLGHAWLVLPWLGGDQRSPQGASEAMDVLNRAGERAATSNVGVAYHNHDFEFEPWPDGGDLMTALLEGTDSRYVSFQLDLYWITHAGHDARVAFERYPGRFVSVHVKDRTSDGRMVAVGDGAIDFAELLERAEAAGVRHAFVEHDRPEDSMRSIERSARHLRAISG